MNSLRLTWVLILPLLMPALAFAHAVGVEVKLKGAQVVVEGFFEDDTPADDAKCIIEDASGIVVHEGKTDAKGVWSFPTPKPGQYKLKLDAGAGHRATKTFTIAEPATQATESAANPQTVSEGATRDEFTRTPWAKIALGLGTIALITGVVMWRQRAKKAVVPTT